MKKTQFYVLLDDPLVVVIWAGVEFLSGIAVALRYAAGRRCRVVVQPSWHVPFQAKENAQIVKKAVQATNPEIEFTFLCPSLDDAVFLHKYGLDGLHVHANAFIDHRIFRPTRHERRLPAVHVAGTEPFKRHWLAWGVEGIGVVTYSWRNHGQLAELLGYRRLGFANFRITDGQCRIGRRLKPREVAIVVSASRCGLILSEKEGQNNASTEYLLCGIPVVSTPSVGGRDAMFEPAHTRIVEPDPQAVEAAVAAYQISVPDPFEIRAAVMLKIREHRRRFIAWLSEIAERDLFKSADEDFWIPQFTNKLKRRAQV